MLIDSFKMIGIIVSIFIFSYMFGIITLAIIPFIILFTILEYKTVIEENYFLAVSLMLCSCAWMIDPLWLDLAFNPFIFCISNCFEKNTSEYYRKSICDI